MNEHTICLSNNTGTEIDKLGILEKKELENKIIKEMINFRTDYCMRIPTNETDNMYGIFRYNERACKRIQKICKHQYKWEIRNLPIVIVSYSKSLKIRKNAVSALIQLRKKKLI